MLKNIEAERGRKGLSKTSVAKVLNISLTTYSNYVKEEWPIPSDVLIKAAQLFGCTVDYLLGLDEPAA